MSDAVSYVKDIKKTASDVATGMAPMMIAAKPKPISASVGSAVVEEAAKFSGNRLT
jgi:hypothetical protein